MIAKTLKWIGDIDGCLELIDQRKLPDEFVRMRCENVEQVSNAIKTLAVRGAPAIGVTAGFGIVLCMQKLPDSESLDKGLEVCNQGCQYLAASRPTAVNLFWALDRIKHTAESFVEHNHNAKLVQLREALLAEASAICTEDEDMCKRIGQNGQRFISDGDGILTHCNAGALATAGQGTALSLMFEASNKGKKFRVYADETRPLLQGARLTAWELQQAGIDVTVICDNMAGWLMKQEKIDAVITGADRIAANGDTANKIGTYSLSILAKEHSIPLYIAAPSSTFDLTIADGSEIPIEQRDPDELRRCGGLNITPDKVNIYNPAFDVTDAGNIAAIITEKGVIENPTSQKIAEHLL